MPPTLVYRFSGPAIVQGDHSALLEVAHREFGTAPRALSASAELKQSPEHIHTYRISPVSLWNNAAAGLGADAIASTLLDLSRYQGPEESDTPMTTRRHWSTKPILWTNTAINPSKPNE